MIPRCQFRIPLQAADAIGLLRPGFLAGASHIEETALEAIVEDTACTVSCSREVALFIAAALQGHAPRGHASLDARGRCAVAASAIFIAIRRLDDEQRLSAAR